MKNKKEKEKETRLQRVIRRSESGEIGFGDVTIRISICGIGLTRFCKLKDFKTTIKEMVKTHDILKVIHKEYAQKK